MKTLLIIACALACTSARAGVAGGTATSHGATEPMSTIALQATAQDGNESANASQTSAKGQVMTGQEVLLATGETSQTSAKGQVMTGQEVLLATGETSQTSTKARVMTGLEVLESNGFEQLKGKRVGLVTNPSGVDRNLRSAIDIMHEAPEVNLVALFGPEHGVRGDAYAGDHVEGGVDAKTGLPVYSLYGPTREPTPAMLKGIDIMVYDIQDVGTRCYTFISTLGLVMRACATAGIEVLVLDRPNPLGGLKVEGPYVQDGFFSFVGQYRIPFVYGLTVGELAVLINEEGLNRGQKGNLPHLKCKLSVVPMKGWKRDMLYGETGLPWVLPSPNIPSVHSAICYPACGIGGEFGHLNIGVGYTIPFQTFAAPWIDADALKAKLDSMNIPGTVFRTIHYKPIAGSKAGVMIHGVEFFFNDYDAATISLTQFYVVQAVQELYPDHNPFPMPKTRMFDIVCGTDYVRINFSKRLMVCDIVDYWNKDADDFRALAKKYYIYD